MLLKNASITRTSIFLMILTILIGLTPIATAQNQEIACQNITLNIQGPEKVFVNKTYNYQTRGYQIGRDDYENGTGLGSQRVTSGNYVQLLGSDTSIQYDIITNNKTLNRFYTDPTSYTFPSPGKYEIQATIDHPQCAYKIIKEVTAYNILYTLIGQRPDNTFSSIAQNAEQKDIGFLQIQKNNSRQTSLQQYQQSITESQAIIITDTNYSNIFESLEAIGGTGQMLNDILIVTQNPKAITKKVIAPFLRSTKLDNIFLLNMQETSNLLIQLSIGESPDYSLFKVSYENKSLISSLDTIIDNLIYQGFPIELMSIILSLTLAVCIVVFRKQVIGFSSFGVYYPILFGLYIHLLGTRTSIGLLLVAFVAIICTNIIYQKFTLLSSAKKAINIVLYFILSLITLRITKKFVNWPSQFVTFSHHLFIIAYFTMPLIAQKVVGTKISKRKKKFQLLLQFFGLTAIVYLIFHNQTIQQTMLIHPVYILVIGIIILILGRYTGLQVVELFRFSHLIKHLLQQKRNRGKK